MRTTGTKRRDMYREISSFHHAHSNVLLLAGGSMLSRMLAGLSSTYARSQTRGRPPKRALLIPDFCACRETGGLHGRTPDLRFQIGFPLPKKKDPGGRGERYRAYCSTAFPVMDMAYSFFVVKGSNRVAPFCTFSSEDPQYNQQRALRCLRFMVPMDGGRWVGPQETTEYLCKKNEREKNDIRR